AVNLSARQFREANICRQVDDILRETGLLPEQLELEITESMLIDDMVKAIRTLEQFRDMGLTLSMDDFGTGYSSLSYLKRFPIHSLKVDQSFIRELTEHSQDAAIVTAIITLARSLGLKVVAEGVENAAQLAFLRERHCDLVQGYLISRPLPPEAFARFVQTPPAAGTTATETETPR
ncbi:MAG: EAL domain-containing protein, partial [Magnetococcales bacterium]|nr:EAL domain-containing protein [Magnetococcales bacterium]